MAVNRRTRWLLLVMVVLLVVAVFVWSGAPGAPRGTAAPPRAGGAQPGGRGDENEQPPRVQLEALQVERAAPGDAERNPFQFEESAPSAGGFAPQEPLNEAALSPTLPQMPTGPPPPPPIPLKFIGVVEQNGKRVAVLSDGRSTPYGTEGAIILGQFRILKIGAESIEMAYIDGRGRQTIRLTGQ
jgi:hypothetical protein